jgi:hypothetical protein
LLSLLFSLLLQEINDNGRDNNPIRNIRFTSIYKQLNLEST